MMYRSSSSTRFSDEFKSNTDPDELPTFNPDSVAAKKERSRLRSAEAAIHLIPLLLVLCAIILWFFSNPDLVNKGDSIVARVKELHNIDNANTSTKNDLVLDADQHFDSSNRYVSKEDSGR